MATEVVMPKIGLNMEEGMIVEWVKKEGDSVKRGDVLFILETDKVTVESEAQLDGVLVKILVKKGERVPVKTPVALITSEGEIYNGGAQTILKTTETLTPKNLATSGISTLPIRPTNGKVLASPKAKFYIRKHALDVNQIAGTVKGPIKFQHVSDYAKEAHDQKGRVLATPLAKRIARAQGLDMATVAGTGALGRINRHDVEEALSSQGKGQKAKSAEGMSPIQGVRAVIAERMLRSSQGTAAVTLHTEADATSLVEFRQVRKAKGHSIVPSYNAILLSLVAKALAEHRVMNARINGENIEFINEINVGLAVDRPDGLRVVVVRGADQKSADQIQVELVALVERAQSNRSTPDDFTGGTFTITNLGEYGVDRFTPIINPPETGILGIGRIAEKLVIRDGKITQRFMVTLSLTFDHRIVDGAPAAKFLQSIVHLIEEHN